MGPRKAEQDAIDHRGIIKPMDDLAMMMLDWVHRQKIKNELMEAAEPELEIERMRSSRVR